ncbi:MFS transporter [Sphingobacterium populi]|uniref:MFS transporter n=1 Tax=Sphingobacterium populi TaxID=1812824 RepID=A0ABW5UGQ9_9SPHI
MQYHQKNNSFFVLLPIFVNFFIMGFVDVVGVATNYVKKDFVLSDTMASFIPMMVFVWFAICAVPTGLLMSKIGRQKTVGLSLVVTVIAMVIPYIAYSYLGVLIAFALLGIGNTILQVALNPLAASVVKKERLTSILTMGQFVKAVSSFLGPILVGYAASFLDNWRFIFLFYGIAAMLSMVVLYTMQSEEIVESDVQTSSFSNVLALLKDKYLVQCIIVIILVVGIDVGLNTSIPQLLMQRVAMTLDEATLGTSLYFAMRTIGTLMGAILLVKWSALKFFRTTIVLAIIAFVGLMFSTSLWMLLLCIGIVGLACANIFSIIFSLALQHDMKHANAISALMIMGVSGGALVLPLQGLITDATSFTAGLSVILVSMLIISRISYEFE